MRAPATVCLLCDGVDEQNHGGGQYKYVRSPSREITDPSGSQAEHLLERHRGAFRFDVSHRRHPKDITVLSVDGNF